MSWPPDYRLEYEKRQQRLLKVRADPVLLKGAFEYYKTRPVEFIEHWCLLHEPRNAGSDTPAKLPFAMFDRQRDLVRFLHELVLAQECGLIEKSRDMGATWCAAAFSSWLWRFWPGASVGFGSRKEQLVDRLGDASSIFEKIRMTIYGWPREFWPLGFNPKVHSAYMRLLNPENGASITGEAGDMIGRGGRSLIYFVDEAAHLEHPESVEASLGDNTRVRVDISSVNGTGNPFHRKRESGVEWSPGQAITKGKANILILDWRDHPSKTAAWYEERRLRMEEEGLVHLFAQEVDRNYAAAVEGIIIRPEWVNAAVDAHVKLSFDDSGAWLAAMDVADGGRDKNAAAARKGVVLRHLDEWGSRDPGEAARRVIDTCRTLGRLEVHYDCVGVGAAVKAETNRLRDDGLLPAGMVIVPWDAGSSPLNPDGRVIEGDAQTPFNKDYYANLKAQGWAELSRRLQRTFRAVTEGVKYDPDHLISFPSDLPFLSKLRKELSQPVWGRSTRLKRIVDKTPDGTASPNLGDAVMMCYWPARVGAAGFLDVIREEAAVAEAKRAKDAEKELARTAPVAGPQVSGPGAWTG